MALFVIHTGFLTLTLHGRLPHPFFRVFSWRTSTKTSAVVIVGPMMGREVCAQKFEAMFAKYGDTKDSLNVW